VGEAQQKTRQLPGFLLEKCAAYIAVGRLMTPSNNAMIAITSNTCIKPVAEYINTPNAQPMMRITAMIYNNEFMVDSFS